MSHPFRPTQEQQDRAHARQAARRKENSRIANQKRWVELAACTDCPGTFTRRAVKDPAVRRTRCPLCEQAHRNRQRAERRAAVALRELERLELQPLTGGLMPCRGCGRGTPCGTTCKRCGDTNQMTPVSGVGRMGHPR